MQFNSYIWSLYKNSKAGKNSINNYNPENLDIFLSEYPDYELLDLIFFLCGDEQYGKLDKKYPGDKEKYQYILNNLKTELKDISEAAEFFNEFISKGIDITGKYNPKEDDGIDFFENVRNSIEYFSVLFYMRYPEYFIPYYYFSEFNKLATIFTIFNIPLPPLPPKKDVTARVSYYFELCKSLYDFRVQYELTPQELCAFLYDFAPNFLEENESELPQPSKVWFCGGGKNNDVDFENLDNSNNNSVHYWQGNIDTRRGDIIVMYCLTPRSYIHSIWRAKTDGFIDPFFLHYKMIYICKPIKTVQISQKELEKNIIFSENSLIRKNMQGINGFGIKYHEYEELLKMMEAKGQDISVLPRIENTIELEGITLENERDIENELVEYLLQKLEYKKDKDYIRQFPIRMGRNYNYYPDYAILTETKKGDERAILILEAKYSISTSKELEDAFMQARTYAVRLQSKCFALAAKQGIWIFPKHRERYALDKFVFFNWIDIYEADNFNRLYNLIGKKVLTGNKELL